MTLGNDEPVNLIFLRLQIMCCLLFVFIYLFLSNFTLVAFFALLIGSMKNSFADWIPNKTLETLELGKIKPASPSLY